jgi:plastocyanin
MDRAIQPSVTPVAVATVLLGLLLALTAVTAPPVKAADEAVSIASFTFDPDGVTVQEGDTVTWTNNETNVGHTVTSDDGAPAAFDSAGVNPGQSFAFEFTEAGTYAYHCDFHPNMTGTVEVQAAAAEPTPVASQLPNGATAPGSSAGTAQGWSLALGLGLMGLGALALVLRRRQGPA